jgi:hypothetical protein
MEDGQSNELERGPQKIGDWGFKWGRGVDQWRDGDEEVRGSDDGIGTQCRIRDDIVEGEEACN